MQQSQQQNTIRINHQIKSKDIRIIDEAGTNLGVKTLSEALQIAKNANADLIEINPKSSPPVCKVMQLGKFKYEQKKAENEAKKNAFVCEVKEVQLRSQTEKHDLEHKTRLAREFLNEGHKVKFGVRVRGREIQHIGLAYDKLKEVLAMLDEGTVVVSEPKAEPKLVSMIVEKKK